MGLITPISRVLPVMFTESQNKINLLPSFTPPALLSYPHTPAAEIPGGVAREKRKEERRKAGVISWGRGRGQREEGGGVEGGYMQLEASRVINFSLTHSHFTKIIELGARWSQLGGEGAWVGRRKDKACWGGWEICVKWEESRERLAEEGGSRGT